MEPTELIKTKDKILPLIHNNPVPKIVWCYWAGGPMNDNRLRSIEMMRDYMGVTVCLITSKNLDSFVVEGFPLHDTFPYLSAVHQSDYLRIYLLHHYGGCWHDVKPIMTNYDRAWKEFDDQNVYLVGKPEIKGGPAKVADKNGVWMPDQWSELVATNRWIGRAGTPLSEELFCDANRFLDEKRENLKKCPAKSAYDKKNEHFWGKFIKNQYPLPWTVFGNLFHPLNYKFKQHIKRTLPFDEKENLGLPHR